MSIVTFSISSTLNINVTIISLFCYILTHHVFYSLSKYFIRLTLGFICILPLIVCQLSNVLTFQINSTSWDHKTPSLFNYFSYCTLPPTLKAFFLSLVILSWVAQTGLLMKNRSLTKENWVINGHVTCTNELALFPKFPSTNSEWKQRKTKTNE